MKMRNLLLQIKAFLLDLSLFHFHAGGFLPNDREHGHVSNSDQLISLVVCFSEKKNTPPTTKRRFRCRIGELAFSNPLFPLYTQTCFGQRQKF